MPSMTPYFICFLVFLCLTTLVWGLIRYYQGLAARKSILERARSGDHVVSNADDEREGEEGTSKKIVAGAVRVMDSIGKRVVKKESSDYSEMKLKFVRAGLRGESVPKVFWGIKGTLALVPLLIWVVLQAMAVGYDVRVPSAYFFYFAVAIGFYAPDVWLRLRREKRKEALFRGFPDALDLLVVCVEAGMGMDSAINRVALEIGLSNRVLSEELRLYNLEMRAGLTRSEALERLANRVDLEDVYALVSLLIQTDKFGTSLVSALKVYSETFRRRRYMRAEEKAAKLPPKLTFPLILLVFPPLLLFTAGPAFLSVFEGLKNAFGGP